MSEDCYFFVDETMTEETRCMAAMCVECQKEKKSGWFWPGELKGYGPYDILCKFCQKVIHKKPTETADPKES